MLLTDTDIWFTLGSAFGNDSSGVKSSCWAIFTFSFYVKIDLCNSSRFSTAGDPLINCCFKRVFLAGFRVRRRNSIMAICLLVVSPPNASLIASTRVLKLSFSSSPRRSNTANALPDNSVHQRFNISSSF